MSLPGSERRVLLQNLLPDTRYSVLVTAEYRNREGGSASAQGKTSESHTHINTVSLVLQCINFPLYIALPDSVWYLLSYVCFSLCTTSQSAGEQRECGAVWPLQYMCVLEARVCGQWLSHSHPGPQRYQLWNEASLTVFRKSSEQVVCFRLFTFLSVHLGSDKQTKEDIVDAASSSHCFSELQPETVYRISVHSRVGTVEGAAVTILHPTGQNPVWVILHTKITDVCFAQL